MLSTAYRIKLEEICGRIERGETVELNEIIWAEKIAKSNHVASRMLRQSRRRANAPNMQEGDLDDFLNQLDLGLVDSMDHKTGFNTVDEIVDFFKRDEEDNEEGNRNWLRRD